MSSGIAFYPMPHPISDLSHRDTIPSTSIIQVNNRHVCHCGKSFIRKEHLRRHQATHGERAYFCHVCQRSFTRNDLLRRHASRHEATSTPDPRRGRACDACHANKTKCDGGSRCTLCTKRNIMCTYRATDPSRASRSPTARARASPNAGCRQTTPSERTFRSARPAPSETSHSSSESIMTTRDIPIPPSGNSEEAKSFQILSTMLAQVEDPSKALEEDFPLGPETELWFRTRFKTYLSRFHDFWPLIHAPVACQETRSLGLLAVITMISCWLEDSQSFEKPCMRIHDALTNRLFTKLSQPVSIDESVWPLSLCQISLFNMIFALCHGDRKIVSRAATLRGLLISFLRQVGYFNCDNASYQQQKHHPATFMPFVHALRDSWKRSIGALFVIDTYISMIFQQPPCLQEEELDATLVSTFALWNCFGLDVFFRRVPLEPVDRSGYKMSDMITNAQSSMRPLLLIEDVQIGLCSLFHSIWHISQVRRRGASTLPPGTDTEESIAFRLDLWKSELERLFTQCKSQFLEDKTDEFPFRAYISHDEDLPRARILAFIRIKSLASNTLTLYHLLCLQLYSDIPTMQAVAKCCTAAIIDSACSPARRHKHQGQLHAWALSPQSRKALIHATAILRAQESETDQKQPQTKPVDPINNLAMVTSGLVLWSWMMHQDAPCACVPGLNHVDLAMDSNDAQSCARLEGWIGAGDTAALDNMAMCRCLVPSWIGRFRAAQSESEQAWDMGRVITPILGLPMVSV